MELLYPTDVDQRLNWPLGKAKSWHDSGALPYVLLPRRFDQIPLGRNRAASAGDSFCGFCPGGHTMSTGTIQKTKMTPPEIARLWGVSVEKVVAFIRSGELRAINAATPGRNQRPRYLIDVDDLEDFEPAEP